MSLRKTGAILATGITAGVGMNALLDNLESYINPNMNAKVERCASALGPSAMSSPELPAHCQELSAYFGYRQVEVRTFAPGGDLESTHAGRKVYLLPSSKEFLKLNYETPEKRAADRKFSEIMSGVTGVALMGIVALSLRERRPQTETDDPEDDDQ